MGQNCHVTGMRYSLWKEKDIVVNWQDYLKYHIKVFVHDGCASACGSFSGSLFPVAQTEEPAEGYLLPSR